jgi:hypothetical protein
MVMGLGVFYTGDVVCAIVPGFGMTEIHCWENAMRFDLASLRPFVEKWLA